jgi:hypothetical protein
MGLGRSTKRFRDHGTSQGRVGKRMDEQQRHAKTLEGVLKDRAHQRRLESEQNFVSSWEQDEFSLRRPWTQMVGLGSSTGCSGATLMRRRIIAGLCRTRDTYT